MGAGAGVKVTSKDFGRPKLVGNDLIVPVLESHMESYTWGVDCIDSGYIEFRGFRQKINELKKEDIDYWGREPYYVSNSGNRYPAEADDVARLDLSNPTFEIYDASIDFWIGSGYIAHILSLGEAYNIDSEHGTNLGIDVWFNAVMREDRDWSYPTEDLTYSVCSTMYVSKDVYFHPSDRFVEMYNYCWDHWADEDFDWRIVEGMFNDDDFYKPNYDLKSRFKGLGRKKGSDKPKRKYEPVIKLKRK